ncbi:MAG: protein kinase [Planctomycetota bacterium]
MNEPLDPTLEQSPLEDPQTGPPDPHLEPTTPLPPDYSPPDPAPSPGLGSDVPQIPDVTLVSVIGRGGMGVVYRGRQTYLERDVAVKLLGASGDSPHFAARFQREAKLLAGMMHPNIVACFSAGTTSSEHCYIVMEFIDGPDLGHWVREHGPLPARDALGVCRDIAAALAHGHGSGIIHRDVKPANVLLQPRSRAAPDDFAFVVKLADLGLARAEVRSADQPEITLAGSILGTPSTMAPEQFDDPDAVDFRADIYGLGCVLYYVLTGQPAFPNAGLTTTIARKQAPIGPDPRKLREDVPEGVAQLVMEMLAANRDHRPASYAVLQARCDALIHALGSSAPGKRRGWRSRAGWVAAACAILALGGWAVWRGPAPTLELFASPEVVEEGVEVRLLAGVQDPEFVFRWRQVLVGNEPTVALANDAAREASFVAPEAAGSYRLTFELSASRGPDQAPIVSTIEFEVVADDDPPRVQVRGPSHATERETIGWVAEASDPEGGSTTYAWSQARQASEPELQLAEATSRTLSLVLPEANADYVLQLVLTVRDGTGRTTQQPLEVKVAATDDAPAITVDGPIEVREAESVRLVARAQDPEGAATTLRWVQTGGPALDLPAAAADPLDPGGLEFDVPYCATPTTLVLEVEASDGHRTVTRAHTLQVLPRADVESLDPGQTLALLTGEMGTRLAHWQTLDRAGTWGDSISSSHVGVVGRNPRGVTARGLPLPPGSWALTGRLEPIVDETGKILEVAGLRFLVGATEAISLEIARSDAGHTARVRRLRLQSDGQWHSYAQPSACDETPGLWSEDEGLHFAIVHHPGRSLDFTWGDVAAPIVSCSLSLSEHQRAHRLDLVVDRGFACFCGFSLRGERPR